MKNEFDNDVFTMTYTDKATNQSDIIRVSRTPFNENDLAEYFEDGEYTINITVQCFPYDVNIYTNLGIYKIRRMRLN